MENQKKWAGWLIAGLVAAVGVVAIVMTTGTAEPPAATQPPVVTVSPSASASPEATQPTPSPAGLRPHRQCQRHRLCRPRAGTPDAG